MNYQECLRYLERVQNLGIKFGLDNVRTILEAFDNPHRQYPSVLVAGTNGKGSVCAFLTRLLTLHDYRVGLFTSPHLVRVEERIRIGERPIPARSFSRVLTKLKEKIEDLIETKVLLSPPTYFELLTCLGLIHFQEQEVDIAVLEVGLGGRFDATNVVDPVVAVVTTISAEHQKFLGETLEQIAFEKAGIIKKGVPVVCGVKNRSAYLTIKKRADELGAPFLGVFEKRDCFSVNQEEKGYSFTYTSENDRYDFVPSLAGRHQGENAAVAVAAAEQVSQRWRNLNKEKIIQGIQSTRWDGRLEVFSRRPLVLLDGAHNEEGAEAVRDYARQFIPTPLILVFAVMKDKRIERIADILFPLARTVILTRFPFYKSASPEEIRTRIGKFRGRFLLEPSPKRAFRLALQQAAAQEVILVTGSLYLVGEIKKYYA